MNRKFKTVIAPVDFSETSRVALSYALDCVSEGGVVVVCHTVDDVPLTYGYVGLAATDSDVRNRLSKGAGEELKAFLPATVPKGITVETEVLHGMPAQEIAALAKRMEADLIVVGTHGRSGLSHALVGSVTEKVIRKAPCPVLVVCPKALAV